MKRLLTVSILSLAAFALPANAALKPGDIAPDFSAQAALGGKDFTFSLTEALKKGPVVLYFYPKSFTKGCTIEAHEFAESYDSFASAGASLIGVSYDPIDVQREFSTKECRDKFPVAADPNLSVISAYDAKRLKPGANGDTVADRISYVVLPDGKIGYALTDTNPSRHVEATLEFVRKWRETQKQ
jgi:thioredoxin-dependent peroxiredoxin